jgi:hypothetical protein
MSSQDWDDSFIERFKQSHQTEMIVAVWLLSRGNEVRVMPKHLREKWEDRLNHADEGDLIVNGKRCEVKGLRRKFEMGKWPFPYALVCSKWSYDRAAKKPDVFFLVSGDHSCTAVVDVVKTCRKWTVVSQQDHERGETYDAYAIDPSLLQWYELK